MAEEKSLVTNPIQSRERIESRLYLPVFSLVPPTGGGGGGTMVPQILRFLIWYPQTGTPKFQQCKPRIIQRSFKFHTKMKRKLHRKTLKLKIFAPAARYGPNRDYFYFSISYFSILGVPGTPKF